MTAQKKPKKQKLVAQEDILREINTSRRKGETGNSLDMSGACGPAREQECTGGRVTAQTSSNRVLLATDSTLS